MKIRKKNPTIYDVAKEANVSVTTVSRVLNDNSVVREDAKERVLKAINILDYKKLKRDNNSLKISKNIGIIIPDITNPFYSEIIKGVQKTSFNFNLNLILYDSENNPKIAEKQINQVKSQPIDGLIFIPPNGFSKLLSLDLPLVYLDRKTEDGHVNYVGVENLVGAYNATKYLISLGHESILYLGGSTNISTEKERLNGYKKAFDESNISINYENVLSCDYSWEKAKSLVIERLNTNSQLPTAIFASNDLMAFGSIEALKSMNLKYPDDISLIGYDDTRYSNLLELTSIAQPAFQMGQNAVLMILDLLKDNKSSFSENILPTSLIIRKSCRQI